jgi:eukaryotic-like serine/threonine-protein kinase
VALSKGTQLDSCEILELLGSGGMGEVYRGRDTKLGREVAVKALPEIFSQDPVRLARFEREAQALAALNHPNIAVIHELKQVDGAKYLILELVDGETLAEMIARGPIPISEAIGIARQIADALEAAHDKGIVHRDLKPANVKVTPEGRVKVLDFGLAKIYEPPKTPKGSMQSLTLTGMQTGSGVILGTAPYMSPEQVRGKDVDRRADVWAFGCVLYEMLTGRQTYPQGETISDTLAGILARDPDWQALPPDLPMRVRALLERCLRKDPAKRLQDMGNARIELEEAGGESEVGSLAAAAPTKASRYEKPLAIAAAACFLLAAGLGARLWFAPAADRPAIRFEATLPNNLANEAGFYLSPDGLKVAFVTAQPAEVWVRQLDSGAAEPIPSTEGIANSNIFWSPNSQDIGFFAEGKLKRVAAAGGPSQVLCALPAGGVYFGTWSTDGVILVASDGSPGGPLLRVSDGGGELKPATELDKSLKETSHRYPYFLPDGRHYLYLVTGGDARDRSTYVGDLKSKERRRLAGIAAETRYSSSGHVVFIRDGALIAQPFDPKRLEFTGAAFPVADPFAPTNVLSYPFSVSMTGAMAYRTNRVNAGTTGGGGPTLLVWYDKNGTRQDPASGDGEFREPELAPDGATVAFARGGPADIHLLDIKNARTDRFTSDAADDLNPRWSPDGKTIAFDSSRGGGANLYTRAVGVTAEDKLVLKSDAAKTMSDWTHDGKYLVYIESNDIWALPIAHDAKTGEWKPADKPIQVTKTPFIEKTARVSPDGRWVAYVSNKAGEDRVFVRSFPDAGVELPVSTAGGVEPRWSRDGKELYFYTGNQFPFTGNSAVVFFASIQANGSSLTVGAPASRAPRTVPGGTSYSVAPDGRFLMQTIVTGGIRGMAGRPVGTNRDLNDVVTIILNWTGSRIGKSTE